MSFSYCDLWLIEPNALRQFHAFATSGIVPEATEEVRAGSGVPKRQKSVAILPIHGVLEARSSFVGSLFGMSMDNIGRAFDTLVADDTVSGIVLDIASPGGMVYGTTELANKIYGARGTKPIIAVANPMAASGAFWIGSAADRLIASPSADVGSIGVIMHRPDISAAMEQKGIKETTIRSSGSPFKGEQNETEPMTDEARQNLQARADGVFETFVGDLAKFRGVSVQHVREHFGKGRLVDARSALAAGMIDRIDTCESTAYKLAAGRIRLGRGEAAQDDWDVATREEALRGRLEARRTQLAALFEEN